MGTSELSGKPDKMLGVTCNGLAFHPGEVALLSVTSCFLDKLRQCWPLGSCADFLLKTKSVTEINQIIHPGAILKLLKLNLKFPD